MIRDWMTASVVALAAILSAGVAAAQNYPTKPIKMIVPLAPGSPVTVSARVVAQLMQGISARAS